MTLKSAIAFHHANPARINKYSELLVRTNEWIIWESKSFVNYLHTYYDVNGSFDTIKCDI